MLDYGPLRLTLAAVITVGLSSFLLEEAALGWHEYVPIELYMVAHGLVVAYTIRSAAAPDVPLLSLFAAYYLVAKGKWCVYMRNQNTQPRGLRHLGVARVLARDVDPYDLTRAFTAWVHWYCRYPPMSARAEYGARYCPWSVAMRLHQADALGHIGQQGLSRLPLLVVLLLIHPTCENIRTYAHSRSAADGGQHVDCARVHREPAGLGHLLCVLCAHLQGRPRIRPAAQQQGRQLGTYDCICMSVLSLLAAGVYVSLNVDAHGRR